jgi:hypothetical protein
MAEQKDMSVHLLNGTNIWICSSCAGYYYDYCNPRLVWDEYEGSPNCFLGSRIVRCPHNKYHFIPTKSYPSQKDVARDFPQQFIDRMWNDLVPHKPQ